MARKFNSTSDMISTGYVYSPTAYTVSAWILTPASAPSGNTGILGFSTAVTFTALISLYWASTPFQLNYADSSSAIAVTTLSASTWYNVVASWEPVAQTLKVYVNGTNYINSFHAQTLPGPNRLEAGGVPGNGFASASAVSIADIALWSIQLSDSEVSGLAKGARPSTVRPLNLLGWWPVDGIQSTEPDLSGNAHNGTVTGTSSVFGPPYTPFTPRWPQQLAPPPVAGLPTGKSSFDLPSQLIYQPINLRTFLHGPLVSAPAVSLLALPSDWGIAERQYWDIFFSNSFATPTPPVPIPYTPNYDWPVPQPVTWYRTWAAGGVESAGPNLYAVPSSWGVPDPLVWYQHWQQSPKIPPLIITRPPFVPTDWPNPQPITWYNSWTRSPVTIPPSQVLYAVPSSWSIADAVTWYQSWTQSPPTIPTAVVLLPFNQYDWPNPQSPFQYWYREASATRANLLPVPPPPPIATKLYDLPYPPPVTWFKDFNETTILYYPPPPPPPAGELHFKHFLVHMGRMGHLGGLS